MQAQPLAAANNTPSWLTFVSTLIWQLIIVYFLYFYRGVLVETFHRLSKFKVAGFEGEFQQQSSSASATILPTTKIEIKDIGPDGFFTVDGLKQLIRDSGLMYPDEELQKTLLLFKTARQRTWLVSGSKTLFCLLDDQNTRKRGSLIQWKQPIVGIDVVRVWPSPEDQQPVVDIGTAEGWLYSTRLHPDPKELENEIRALLRPR